MGGRIGVGLVGFGTVGTGVVRILTEKGELLRERLGADLELVKIADVDLERPRSVQVDPSLLTTDAREVIHHSQVDVVVELVGGIEPAKTFILEALRAGKPVVTANKALLAEAGEEILQALEETGLDLGFEASVAGGIPILKALREGLVANTIARIYGIINGTANYVLTMMEKEGLSFQEALTDAQAKGYAEADPTLDISGMDAAHKAAILATMAFGRYFKAQEVYVEGIDRVDSKDILYAQELGYRVKLLAIIKGGKQVEIRVHPTMIPLDHSLAKVEGVFNAVYVEGDGVGPAMFYGRGAGEMPTASAVVADVVDIARDLLKGVGRRVPPFSYDRLDRKVEIKPMDEVVTRYYMRFTAQDRPGVLSKISGILASRQISIESVIQKGRREEGTVPVVMMTHEAMERDVREALEEIDQLDVIGKRTVLIRVEDGGGW
ncbi:MAG: homoserine dehydrogenase [Aquificota bacterium]|nr:MAG: homoserine dehydrogenase [Aquificota bacterium]